MIERPNQERVVFVDYVRVVACFLVMLVHASENYYMGNDTQGILATESTRLWTSLYDGFIGRTSVPLFMIVSAFLLVPIKKTQTMTSFYARRFKKILPPFILFLLLYCCLPMLWGGMDWGESKALFSNVAWNFPGNAGHLWFMYPLISIYLIIPVVSPWLEKSSAKEELIFIVLFAISTFHPWLIRYVADDGNLWGECLWNEFSMLWYCSGYLGYLVVAHFIRVHLKWNISKRILVGSLMVLVGGAFTAWSFWDRGVPGVYVEYTELEWAWEFCTPNVLISTVGMFLLFTCIKPTHRAPRIVTEISKLSFGMYLMHMFFLSTISAQLVPALPVYVAIPAIAISSYICCIITTKLISLLPSSKWIVGV